MGERLMSDTKQGPDWWQASDGKWYPPQGQAPPPPVPPVQKKKGGCLKFGLIALGVLLVLGIIGGVLAASAGKKAVDNIEASSRNKAVDPSNPDSQKEDQNVAIGDSVELSGYTTTVKSAVFQPEVSEFEKGGYVVAEVTIANRDTKSQAYNPFDFKLQTPEGQVVDPSFSSIDGQLHAGDLIKGGSVTGKIVWQVGATKGDFFVIYKPDPFDAARGLWKVTI